MIDKTRFFILICVMVVIIWADLSYEYYKNHKLKTENTAQENYRIKLYNSAIKINDEAAQRCADMSLRTHATAISDSVRCLKAIVK